MAVLVVLLALTYKAGTYYLEQQLTDALREAVRSSQGEFVTAAAPRAIGDGEVKTATSVVGSTASGSPSGLTLLSSLPVTLSAPVAQPAPANLPAASSVAASTPLKGSPSVLPDLRIVSLSLSPPSPVRGKPVTASIKGANRGSGVAQKIPVLVNLEYQVLGKWVPIVGVWGTVDLLGPGDEITMQRTASLPSQLAAGLYRVTASVDPQGTIVPFNPESERRKSMEFVVY